MVDDGAPEPTRALAPDLLMRMATFYLARHSASAERLRAVLARKIARHLEASEAEPLDEAALQAMIELVVERLTRTGLLDDAAFARGRAASLAAKGRPAWRIKAELAQVGVDADAAGLSETLQELDSSTQAMVWARRRRLGPFRQRDRALHRERDIASLARAGFSVSVARQVVDGGDEDRDGCGHAD
jgi:regulatory protein